MIGIRRVVQVASALAAAQVEAWVEGHLAAAGSCWTCWQSQERSVPSPSRVVRGRICLTLARKARHEKKQPDTYRFQPGRAGWFGGATQEEHLRLQRNASVAEMLQAAWACLVFSECALTDDSLLPLWPDGLLRWGKRYWSNSYCIRYGSCSGFACILPMDSDFLAYFE